MCIIYVYAENGECVCGGVAVHKCEQWHRVAV